MNTQEDLIVNQIPVVVNTDYDCAWMEHSVTILKPDATDTEVMGVMSYLYEEGFILDRRTPYEIK